MLHAQKQMLTRWMVCLCLNPGERGFMWISVSYVSPHAAWSQMTISLFYVLLSSRTSLIPADGKLILLYVWFNPINSVCPTFTFLQKIWPLHERVKRGNQFAWRNSKKRQTTFFFVCLFLSLIMAERVREQCTRFHQSSPSCRSPLPHLKASSSSHDQCSPSCPPLFRRFTMKWRGQTAPKLHDVPSAPTKFESGMNERVTEPRLNLSQLEFGRRRLLQLYRQKDEDDAYFVDYIPPARDAITLPRSVVYVLAGAMLIVVATYAIVGHLINDLLHDLAGNLQLERRKVMFSLIHPSLCWLWNQSGLFFTWAFRLMLVVSWLCPSLWFVFSGQLSLWREH